MQPTRRRKKRPNYGIRTVEVCRGKNGFGFTISGQQPCILSCIVPNSPAEQAGLRPGDYLIAVCGQNVSKVPHDDVVQLIGNCHGILKLQIAENYYSDSSEEDFVSTARQKPKYPHKYKNSGHNTHPLMQSKCNKMGSSVIDGYSFDEEFESLKTIEDKSVTMYKNETAVSTPSFNIPSNTNFTLERNCMFQCIVGYLGTIEMPKKLTPVSRLQIVRSCIKRLRAEKRNHTPVMMNIFPCSLRLKNKSGTTIAVYPGGRVTFCSSSNEQNKKYFGIVTTSVSDEPSNSCHVFVMLNDIHSEHTKIAAKFDIECPSTANGVMCAYFPATCDPIVSAIQKYYQDQRNGLDLDEPLPANSPQPSNDSSVTTSNSDSGIGFRDDSGHQSDRILVVDIQNQRLHIQAAGLSDPQFIDCCAEKSDRSNCSANPSALQASLNTQTDKLQANCYVNNEESAENLLHWTNRQYQSVAGSRWPSKSFEDMTSIPNKMMQESLERRLSPKVFSYPCETFPVSQSLEDLKMQSELYEDLEPNENFMKKHSLQDLTVFSTDSNSQSHPLKTVDGERKVTSWATCLEKLLNDTVGLHIFAEFLKKEFSVENAYFWAACEKYRMACNAEERAKLAHYIYERFLSNNATEPVNVDSSGKNLTQQQLQNADMNLLQNAQKQIFNLMKFDSYPRFLKSDLYKNYLMREIAGENITMTQEAIDQDLLVACNAAAPKTKTPKDSTDETAERTQRTSRRRRSLLPWTRSRAKSRDRAVANNNENISSCSSSRTSLASWDLALPSSLCKVVLPDSSSIVSNVQPQQTVRYLVTRLLEKRTTPYTSFQVIFAATDEVIDLEENATVLAGKEVKIEWRIEFRLDLPDRKSLTVKSKPTHTLGAVLGPILIKHGYSLQMVTLCLMSENEVLEPSQLVGTVDKQRIQVLTRNTPTPNLQGWNYCGNAPKAKQASTLDEITNRVFEELLQGKAENYRNPQTEHVTSAQSEDWSSDHSSKILSKFLRKDSFHQDKHRRTKKYADEPSSAKKNTINRLPAIARWKPSTKLDFRSEKDCLYEGLKRCQRGRLEDQRGTEINVELPEFLKDKENTPNSRKKMKKIRKETSSTTSAQNEAVVERETAEITVTAQESCSSKANDVYQMPVFGNDIDCVQNEEDNIYANDALNFGGSSTTTPSLFKEPPPLPPKPQNITWRVSNSVNYSSNYETSSSKSVYLDHPTSSFV